MTAPCSDINAENNTLIAPFQNLGNQIVSAGFLAAEGARIQGNAAQALVDIAAEKCIGTRRTLFVFHTDESGPAFYIGDDGSKVFYVPEENLIGEVTGVNSQGVEERQYISHVDADCIGEQPTDTISPGLIAGASAISTAAIGLAILGLYIMLARETTAERNEHLEDSREGVEGADEPEYKSKSEDLNNFLDTLDFKTNLDFISTDGFIKPLEELIKTVDFESQHFTYDKTKAARIIKAHGLNEAINDRRFGLFLASVAFPLFGASAGLLLATSPATRAAAFLAPTIAPVAAGIVYTSKFGEKFREANQDIAAFPKPSRKDEHSPQTAAQKALGELDPYCRLKMGKIDEAEATRHSLPVSLSTSDMRRDSQHLGNAFQYYKLVRSSLAKGDISVKQDKNGHFTSTWHTEYIKPFIQQESLNPTKIVYPTVVTGTQLKTLDPVDRPIVLEDTAKKSGEQPTTTDTPTPPVTREPITASLKHHSWITQLFRLEGVPPYRGIQMDHDNTLRFKEDIDIGVEHSDAIPRGTSAFLAVREKHQDFPVSDTARIDSLKKAAVFDRIHFQLQLLNYIEATRFSEGAEETKAEENPLFEAAYQFIDIESLTELRKIRKRVLDCREQLLLAWDLRPPEKPARKPFTLDTARNNFSLKQAERHTPSNIFGRFRSAVTNRELTTPLLSSVHDDADKDDTDGLADIPEEEQVELGRAGDTAANPIDRMLNALKNASDGVNFQMDSNQERELRNHLIKGNYVEALAHIDGLILQRDRTPLGVVTVRREISGMLS